MVAKGIENRRLGVSQNKVSPEYESELSTKRCQPQSESVWGLEVLKVGGKSRRSERVKANQKERPDSVQDPETVQELDNIHQIEYARVARRVARRVQLEASRG